MTKIFKCVELEPETKGKKKSMQIPENYKLEDGFEEGTLYDIDLKPYLTKFTKNSWWTKFAFFLILKFRIIEYQIVISVKSDSVGSRSDLVHLYEVYRDAKYNFVLMGACAPHNKKQNAIASVGFDFFDNTKKSIIINQIQGVRYKKHLLKFLRWEKMLVQITVDWARKNGFEKVFIQPSKKNHWYTDRREKNLYLKYNVTAKRCGFKYNKEKDIFEKQLTESAY